MFLVLMIILCSIISPVFAEETPEKAAFDLPDVVIRAEDRSKSDLLQKKDPSSLEVQYQKEVPTSQKINPELLETEKILPLSIVKKDSGALNHFHMALGNVTQVNYRFVHGHTIPSQSYLWGLSRELRGNYIPNAGRSFDELSLDYTFKFSPEEKIAFSARAEKRKTTLPIAQSISSGNHEVTFLPLRFTYEKILGNKESINVAFQVENIDVHAGNSYRNWFGLEANADYNNNISNELSYTSSLKLNNAVSNAGFNLEYKPLENTSLSGSIGGNYYQTFFPKIQNESFLAPSLQLQYELSGNTLFRLLYNPRITAFHARQSYVTSEYTEINYNLLPQTEVLNWQALISQQLYQQINWQARIGVRRNKQAIGYVDIDNNGFIEPLNLGWSSLFEAELTLSYYLDSLYSLRIDYYYQNNRLDSGQQVPGKPGQVLTVQLDYKDTEGGLNTVLALEYTADQLDMVDTTQKLPDYFLVNFEASKALNRYLKINTEIKNIFNTIYYQRGDFREPGLSIQLGGETAF